MKEIETVIILIIGMCVGYYSAKSEEPEVQVKVEQIKIDNSKFLTVDDLDNIYECVDIKIENANAKDKFPCTAVRGDSW